MLKILKKSFAIPYDDNLTPPNATIAKDAVAHYCGKNNLPYEFKGETEDGNTIIEIDGKEYEIRHGFGIGQCGFGGYGISCREL